MKKTGDRWYFECPDDAMHGGCGIIEARYDAKVCPNCKQVLKNRRNIETYEVQTTDDEESKKGCMSVCIHGTRTCNCKCQGRCHGAGKCYC